MSAVLTAALSGILVGAIVAAIYCPTAHVVGLRAKKRAQSKCRAQERKIKANFAKLSNR